MDINYFLIIAIIIMVICVIRGMSKGIIRIIYGVVSWIFLIWFVNFACTYVSDYLNYNTSLSDTVQESINTHLHDRYNTSEVAEEGTGEAAVLAVVPFYLQDKITEAITTSVEAAITLISVELTDAAIKGIATIISVVAGILIIFILDKLIKLVGLVPGVRDVNKLLGFLAGFAEGMLIIWLCMYIADCFPATDFGRFVIDNTTADPILGFVYQINIIEKIFRGI